MNKLPLVDALLNYHNEENLILSMPGNKCGLGFKRDEIGKELERRLGSLDITEVDPLDNLHHPEGVIKEAQNLLRDYYGCKKAFFMVNGSTGGNLASIFSAFNEGDEVLVERNCHRSIYNGLLLRKLKVIYINPIIMKNGLFLPPGKTEIEEALSKSTNPKGIILTYPNYFGIVYDVEKTLLSLQKRGLKVVIDQAHGAHFGICEELPKSLSMIADYVVVSAHKTLPALTGGAYLLVNSNDENVEFYVSSFMTTSPSYLIMASLDYSRYYLENYGLKDYKNLINYAEKYKSIINNLGKVSVLSDEDLPNGYYIDKSRYVLILKEGYSGHKLLDYFRINKIQAEMSTDSSVLLILSPFQGEEAFKDIVNALERLDLSEIKSSFKHFDNEIISVEKALDPYEVFNMKEEIWNVNEAEGKILKEAIVPYPPGIPLICSGEIINSDIIRRINRLVGEGVNIIGINEGRVKIV